jgi:trehalose 6-phosphate synthase/phosphatase
MCPEERRARMRTLRQRVMPHDVHAWAGSFIEQLRSLQPRRPVAAPGGEPAASALARASRTSAIRLLLDYDGTLVPLARSPELAAPDPELLAQLQQLASRAGIRVDIVSGRSRESLDAWFGDLPIDLWAEHGVWHRSGTRPQWLPTLTVASDWMDLVKPILDQFTASTPGALVEVKSASLAWHYRQCSREAGVRRAHQLRLLLGELLINQPVELLEGRKVLEIRLRGASKALVARHAAAESSPRTAIVAFGDDETDEDMFRALPPGSLSIAVGRAATAARYVVDDYRAVRRLLQSLLADAEESPRPFLSDHESPEEAPESTDIVLANGG